MRSSFLAICLLLSGCGATAAQASASRVTTPVVGNDTRVAALVSTTESQARRIQELEARLAMLESDTRTLRSRVENAEQMEATRAVRIGGSRRHESDDSVAEVEAPAPRARASAASAGGPRPVLRIVGTPERAPDYASGEAAELPEGIPSHLPVVAAARPGSFSRDSVPAIPQTPLQIDPVEDYRAALGLVNAQRFDEAHVALTHFVDSYPSHPYADNALFWRAEVRYLQRNYGEALVEYEAVLRRFPEGNKAPDALYKIGMCHTRLGNAASARDAFERVKHQYPTSEAARLASQQEAS